MRSTGSSIVASYSIFSSFSSSSLSSLERSVHVPDLFNIDNFVEVELDIEEYSAEEIVVERATMAGVNVGLDVGAAIGSDSEGTITGRLSVLRLKKVTGKTAIYFMLKSIFIFIQKYSFRSVLEHITS